MALDLAPHAQQVAAPQLGDVRVAEAGLAQRGGDVAGFAGVLPAGDAAAAVEVGGDADVVDAGHLHHVADLLDVVVERRQRILLLDLGHARFHLGAVVVVVAVVCLFAGLFRHGFLQFLLGGRATGVVLEEFLVGDGVDHAALGGDRAQQVVGQVAWMVEYGAGAGMRGDDRRARHFQRIAHAIVRGVRDVDHHAEFVGALDYRAAEVAHALVAGAVHCRFAVFGVGQRAGAQVVVADVDQADRARTAVVGGVEAMQVVAERVGVLDLDGGREQARLVVGHQLLGRGGQADAVGILHQHAADAVVLLARLLHRLGVAGSVELVLRHPDHEERRVEPTAFHLAQVDQQAGVVAHVEARLAHVVERDVDVGVDGDRRTGLRLCRQRERAPEGGEKGETDSRVHGVFQFRAGCSPAIISSKCWRRRTTA